MANRFWLGVNSNLTDTANWSATRGGAGGQTVPGSSDVAYFYDGSTDITTNLTGFAAGSVFIGGEFRGNIGGAGSSLTCSTTGCVVQIDNVPKNYINIAAATTIAGVNIYNTGSGTVNLTGGTITTVNAVGERGRVIVGGSCEVTNYYGVNIQMVAEAGTAFTILHLRGGFGHQSYRGFGTFVVDNAGLTVLNTATATAITTTGNSVYAHQSNGTITTAESCPGSRMLAGDLPFTLTNSTEWLGGSLFDNAAPSQITKSNPTTIRGRTA